jgi:antigen flippase
VNAASQGMRRAAGLLPGSFLSQVGRTAGFNTIGLVATSMGGFLLAIALPASTRGAYAGVQSWFLVALVFGELGIPAALTYYAAREPNECHRYLGSAQRLLAVSGLVTTAVGLALVAPLARGNGTLALAYTLVFAFVPCAFVLGAYTFVLQATSIARWNVNRLVQPGLYLCGVILLVALRKAGLLLVVAILIVSFVAQGIIAVRQVRQPREGTPSGVGHRGRLLRFGLASLLGSGPAFVNTRIDQVVLSTFAAFSGLGQYAVAVSASSLVVPVVAALGQVALPRLARATSTGEDIRTLVARILVLGPVTAAVLSVPIYLATQWIAPHLLGHDYSDVPQLVLLLLPGTVGLAAGNALGDTLRGLGRPQAVAWAQGGGAVLTVVGLAILVPRYGVTGAAIVSSAAYCLVWLVQIVIVRAVISRLRTEKEPVPCE